MAETAANAGHRLDEVVDLHDGQLDPEARAAFEEHLAGCVACRGDLAQAKGLLPALNRLIAAPPGLSTDELLARMRAKEEALSHARPARAARREEPPRRLFWIAGLLAVGGAVAALALWRSHAAPEAKPVRQRLYAPRRNEAPPP